MGAARLELRDLGRLVAAERNRRGLSLRDAAENTGVPFNTLARVERGHVPDLPKFKRLVDWCGLDINQFFELQDRAEATPDVIAEHLRADPNLPEGAADQIAGLVSELYRALARPQRIVAAHLRAAATFRPEATRVVGTLLSDMHSALLKETADGPSKRL